MTRNGGAERMRRYRERKRQGVVCMVQVPIYALDADALVKCGRLGPEDEKNREKIAEVVPSPARASLRRPARLRPPMGL